MRVFYRKNLTEHSWGNDPSIYPSLNRQITPVSYLLQHLHVLHSPIQHSVHHPDRAALSNQNGHIVPLDLHMSGSALTELVHAANVLHGGLLNETLYEPDLRAACAAMLRELRVAVNRVSKASKWSIDCTAVSWVRSAWILEMALASPRWALPLALWITAPSFSQADLPSGAVVDMLSTHRTAVSSLLTEILELGGRVKASMPVCQAMSDALAKAEAAASSTLASREALRAVVFRAGEGKAPASAQEWHGYFVRLCALVSFALLFYVLFT